MLLEIDTLYRRVTLHFPHREALVLRDAVERLLKEERERQFGNGKHPPQGSSEAIQGRVLELLLGPWRSTGSARSAAVSERPHSRARRNGFKTQGYPRRNQHGRNGNSGQWAQ